MIRTKLLLGCALALSMFVGSTAFAQGPVDQRTYFTFSAPFELPGGKTLPAGKYTFRVLDSPSNRHIVQVLNEDGTQIQATLLAIPAQRQDPPSEPEIRFMEAAANVAPAVRTWWYPGRTIGHEFIYPKDHARRLAQRQSEPVLSVASDATTAEETQTAELERVNGSSATVSEGANQATDGARTTEQARAEQPAPAPRAEQRAPAPRVEQPAPAPAPDRTTRTEPAQTARAERTELPRTASALPMIALLGVASLVASAALRRRRA
jgi:hypothetical protein